MRPPISTELLVSPPCISFHGCESVFPFPGSLLKWPTPASEWTSEIFPVEGDFLSAGWVHGQPGVSPNRLTFRKATEPVVSRNCDMRYDVVSEQFLCLDLGFWDKREREKEGMRRKKIPWAPRMGKHYLAVGQVWILAMWSLWIRIRVYADHQLHSSSLQRHLKIHLKVIKIERKKPHILLLWNK